MMGTYRKFDFTLNSCSAYTAFDRESSGGDDDEYEKVTGYYMATCSDDVVTVTSYSDSACSSSDSVFTFDGGEVVFKKPAALPLSSLISPGPIYHHKNKTYCTHTHIHTHTTGHLRSKC
jgi:hypothetical protein